jgi:hypothetical protein
MTSTSSPCRYKLTTSLGELDGSRDGFLALSVDGSVLGRIRTQKQLATLESKYGSVVLLDSQGDSLDDVVRSLADPSAVVGVSRQGNQRAIIDAALDAAKRSADSVAEARSSQSGKIIAAVTGTLPPGEIVSLNGYTLPPEGSTDALVTRLDSFMALSSGLSPAAAALLGADIPGSLSPSPDPGRTPICKPPQDPGANWKMSLERQVARNSKNETSEDLAAQATGLVRVGSIVHARAYAMALGNVSSLMQLNPGESISDAFYRLSGNIAVLRLREAAMLRAGDSIGASEVSSSLHDLRELQERFALSYVAAARELMREVRTFGSSDAKSKLIEHKTGQTAPDVTTKEGSSWVSRIFKKDQQASRETPVQIARRAVDYLPASWLASIPVIEVAGTESFSMDAGGGNELGGFYRPPNEWTCVQDLLALNRNNIDRSLGTAVHELVHVAQYYNPSLREAEQAYLSSYRQEERTTTVEGLSDEPVPAGRYHVRHVIPGDPYANVCATNTTLIAAIATSGSPTAPHEAAAMMHSNIEMNEFLPQFASWISYAPIPGVDVVSGDSQLKQWTSQLWLSNPEAVSFGLGLFASAE